MQQLEFLDEIALLGLAKSAERGATEAEICKRSANFARQLQPALADCLARLAKLGFASELARKERQKGSRWQITVSGTETLACLLGGTVPKTKTWRATSLRILSAAHTLKLDRPMAASLLKKNKLSLYLLATKLGEEFDANTTLKGVCEIVAGKALGVSRGDSGSLWKALLHRAPENPVRPATASALSASQLGSGQGSASSSPVRDLTEEELVTFVLQVENTSRTIKEGWFSPQKLFIHRAWEAWRTSCSRLMDLPQFKHALLQGLRVGLVELSRADYPVGVDPTDLNAALTVYGSENFHFINLNQEKAL
jgi:hypothetical protein